MYHITHSGVQICTSLQTQLLIMMAFSWARSSQTITLPYHNIMLHSRECMGSWWVWSFINREGLWWIVWNICNTNYIDETRTWYFCQFKINNPSLNFPSNFRSVIYLSWPNLYIQLSQNVPLKTQLVFTLNVIHAVCSFKIANCSLYAQVVPLCTQIVSLYMQSVTLNNKFWNTICSFKHADCLFKHTNCSFNAQIVLCNSKLWHMHAPCTNKVPVCFNLSDREDFNKDLIWKMLLIKGNWRCFSTHSPIHCKPCIFAKKYIQTRIFSERTP